MSPHRLIKTPDALAQAGLIGSGDTSGVEAVAERYAIGLTPDLAALITETNYSDPIYRQFVPDMAELSHRPEELADPIGDNAHAPCEGLVHRHKDRVLLKIVSVCPVYCRFCFRREMVGPGKDDTLRPDALDKALAYIREHSEIWEVILTGGDPFMLSPRRAKAITRALSLIDHVKVIRWHTRMPVADPDRVTDEFADAIASTDTSVFVAVHANHAREFTPQARLACKTLSKAGISLVSQSVLLRGVNDSLPALQDLMRAFVEAGVKPYYLHQMDFAPGTSHFRVPVEEGQKLVQALRDQTSGLCVPTYVVDIPGGVSKANASPSDLDIRDDTASVRGRDGEWRAYPKD